MATNVAKLMRRDLMAYSQGIFRGFQIAKHHRAIMLTLMLAERRVIERLVITMPPRHGKSLLASQIFPSWWLGRNGDDSVIVTSYSGDLAWHFGNKIREFMFSEPFQLAFGGVGGVNLNPRTPKRVNIMGRRGSLHLAGVGGGITGRGGDLFIIDDPFKDDAEAASPVIRQKKWEWFASTAYTRLMPSGVMLLIATRWHEDDLSGRVLRGNEPWHHLHFPALSTKGEALWPTFYPAERLISIRNTIGNYHFEALYQGNPVPPEGGLFKFEWFNELAAPWEGESVKRVRYWDVAATEGAGDYTAGVLMARNGKDYAVESIYHGQFSPARRNRIMRRVAKEDHAKFPHMRHVIELPPGFAADEFKTSIRQNVYYDMPVEFARSTKSKEMRFDPLRTAGETGHVYIVKNIDKKNLLIDEWCKFPLTTNDDLVDCGSGSFLALSGTSNFFDWLDELLNPEEHHSAVALGGGANLAVMDEPLHGMGIRTQNPRLVDFGLRATKLGKLARTSDIFIVSQDGWYLVVPDVLSQNNPDFKLMLGNLPHVEEARLL